jgi:hypothetical protein
MKFVLFKLFTSFIKILHYNLPKMEITHGIRANYYKYSQ